MRFHLNLGSSYSGIWEEKCKIIEKFRRFQSQNESVQNILPSPVYLAKNRSGEYNTYQHTVKQDFSHFKLY